MLSSASRAKTVRQRTGISTRMKKSAKPSLNAAMNGGNSAKSIVMTTTLRVGELIIAANVDSSLAPALRIAWAMGAAQLTHTPRGAPTRTPIRVLAKAPSTLRRCIRDSSVMIAAASRTPKTIPRWFVCSQLAGE